MHVVALCAFVYEEDVQDVGDGSTCGVAVRLELNGAALGMGQESLEIAAELDLLHERWEHLTHRSPADRVQLFEIDRRNRLLSLHLHLHRDNLLPACSRCLVSREVDGRYVLVNVIQPLDVAAMSE
jgi:hypothetical protein